jgi:hypothetical protein
VVALHFERISFKRLIISLPVRPEPVEGLHEWDNYNLMKKIIILGSKVKNKS